MDVNAILLDILVVLVAAKIAAEIAERINIPAVVGRDRRRHRSSVRRCSASSNRTRSSTRSRELGVILLLLEVGHGDGPRASSRSVGRASILGRDRRRRRADGRPAPVAGLALGFIGEEAVFVGAALDRDERRHHRARVR